MLVTNMIILNSSTHPALLNHTVFKVLAVVRRSNIRPLSDSPLSKKLLFF